jgi:hypothetical protein
MVLEKPIEPLEITLGLLQLDRPEAHFMVGGALRQPAEIQRMHKAEDRISPHGLTVCHEHNGLAFRRNLHRSGQNPQRPLTDWRCKRCIAL